MELQKDFIPVSALAKSSNYTERENCPYLYSKQVTSAMNGMACCRNVYGSNFLCHSQILCRYFRFVGHHSALFDDNKNNCPTVRGGPGFVDLIEDQNFPGSLPCGRISFVVERV
jgi:hypothetical protein